jgi:hypothetical protein
MEPVSIAIICVAVFGVVVGLTAFIRQLLLSRDKNLNDLAQQRALAIEAGELEKLRTQMVSNKRFDSHYQVLGANKEDIQYIDQKIDEILKIKMSLIQRYSQVVINESSAIIAGTQSPERKATYDKLKYEMDNELRSYDQELENLQTRRKNLWNTHEDLQDYLLVQEKKRNDHLDEVYQQHSSMLEKLYLRHNENSELVAKQSIEAGNSTFKTLIKTPVDFLLGIFGQSDSISESVSWLEMARRRAVKAVEDDINGDDNYEDDRKVNEPKDDNQREGASLVL